MSMLFAPKDENLRMNVFIKDIASHVGNTTNLNTYAAVDEYAEAGGWNVTGQTFEEYTREQSANKLARIFEAVSK